MCYSIPIHPSRELFFRERRRKERERERIITLPIFCTLFSIKFPPSPSFSAIPHASLARSNELYSYILTAHLTCNRERSALLFFILIFIYIFYNTLPLILIRCLERGTGLNSGLKPTHYLRRPGKKEKRGGCGQIVVCE